MLGIQLIEFGKPFYNYSICKLPFLWWQFKLATWLRIYNYVKNKRAVDGNYRQTACRLCVYSIALSGKRRNMARVPAYWHIPAYLQTNSTNCLIKDLVQKS